MKKKTAVLSLVTVAGFSVLSATPAMAVGTAYDNCSDAAAQGVYNIPAGSPGYGTHLDSDLDGIGCENGSAAPAPAPAPAPVDNTQQVTQMPVGGADTGVPTENPANISALALTGGLVLAAAGGGTYVLRRRAAVRA
jgi:hypothetical protein